MRWDSPFVLAGAGTIAIHIILIVAADAITVYNPYRPAPPAPRIEMVEIEVPPAIIAEPPPPIAPPEPIKQPDQPPQPKECLTFPSLMEQLHRHLLTPALRRSGQ